MGASRAEVQISVRIPRALLAHLDWLVERAGRPRSEVVRHMLAKATLHDLPDGWRRSAEASRAARRVTG
jgi:metal-responsive CopG/Arc/MetJ family transcriptional regulator